MTGLTQAKEIPMAQANGLSTPLSPSPADAKADPFTAKSNPSATALTFSTIHYKAVRKRLQAEDPSLDEQTLADTVEGLTDLNELLAAIIRAALADEALASGLKGRIGEMEDRLGRLQDRAAKRRQIAKEAMAELDIKKLQAPDFTASLRPGMPSLLVSDEAAVPSIYWEPRPPKLNRVGLLTDLKQGTEVSGAALSNPEPILTVRTR
jgi:Siphovirus Gp157